MVQPRLMAGHELTISTSDLDSAGREYHFVLRSAWVRGVLEGLDVTSSGQDGALDLRASKSGNDVVVHGRLAVGLAVPCARCLEPARIDVDEEVSVLFVPGAAFEKMAAAPVDEAGGMGDADLLPYDGHTVILDDLVRDELVLEVPMTPLCSDSCAGMQLPEAARSGTEPCPGERGPDPRLLPLQNLRSKVKE